MKFGVVIHKPTMNLGDDIQTYAAAKLLPHVDYQIDREYISDFKSENDEPVAVIMNAWWMWKKWNWPPADCIIPKLLSMHINNYGVARKSSPIYAEWAQGCGGEFFKKYGPVGCRDMASLHFYYSHLDWAREDYPWGRTGQGTGRSNSKGDWKSYYQFMNNQLTELLTNYGPIGAIWFDGWWDQPKSFNWELPEQYALIHKLQPGCLVGNNHHQTPFDGEDIQIFERDLPGENASGLSGQEVSRLPLETCETMNGMWGYKITDQNYKSTKTLIHYLVKAAGKNANLLMNIGPQPDGELPAVAVQRLAEMGEWMKQYGETIYGTRSGIVAPHDWGVTTQKGNKLYVHILDLKDAALFLPLTGKKVKKAVLFKDQSPVRFTKTKAGVLLEFAEVPKDIDYVVELTID